MQLKYARGFCIFVALLLVCMTGGCGGEAAAGQDAASEEESPAAEEHNTGEDEESPAAEGTPATDETVSPTPEPTPEPTATGLPKGTLKDGWIEGIPEYVPKFECGTVDADRTTITEGAVSTLFILQYTGIAKADVDVYAEALKAGGYAVAVEEIGSTYTLTASLDKGWGSVTLVITLTEEDGEAIYSLGAPV